MADEARDARRRVSLDLSLARIAELDALRKEWGIRSRGDVLERLLEEIFDGDGTGPQGQQEADEAFPGTDGGAGEGAGVAPASSGLDEQTALILVGRSALETTHSPLEETEEPIQPTAPEPRGRGGGGIDLPGFVTRRSSELRSSFRSTRSTSRSSPSTALPSLRLEEVEEAMEVVGDHWRELYGHTAGEAVLEAAMVWLAKDIWPLSDQSEGRLFTWSAASQLMGDLIPGWEQAPPSFERVMVTAGVLEDPFSGSTLSVRIPTLVRRFVHRFRRRRRGTSFQALEHTMTVQGALKLLELPTTPGQRFTLVQIRDAYRQQAISHHPDSGGSAEVMRRLNEAYQLLKELYRQDPG